MNWGIKWGETEIIDFSDEIKSGIKRHSGIGQELLDEIGVESTDSESDNDNLPVPSIYAKSRNSSLSRSKSMGSLGISVQDDDCYPDANFCSGTTVMPSPKRFGAGIGLQQPAQPLVEGMRRSASMPCMKKSRSGYNRAIGEALANSPKKAPVSTKEDLAIMEMLLSGL
jgi:hypothetical protein